MRVIFVSVFILIADQVSKLFVKGFSIPFFNIEVKGMSLGESISVIGDFFRITYVENPGMAFGIDVDGYLKLFLSLFSLVAAIGLVIYIYKIKHERFINRLALALILGGALGNFIDRAFYGVFYDYAPIFYGHVVDFFQVEFWDFTLFGKTYNTWPIFNIADASVSIGVVLMVIFHGKIDPKEEENESAPEEEKSDLNEISSDVPVNEAHKKEVIDGENNIGKET